MSLLIELIELIAEKWDISELTPFRGKVPGSGMIDGWCINCSGGFPFLSEKEKTNIKINEMIPIPHHWKIVVTN